MFQKQKQNQGNHWELKLKQTYKLILVSREIFLVRFVSVRLI